MSVLNAAKLWLDTLKRRYPNKVVPRWNVEDISKELSKMVRIDGLNEKQVFDISLYAINDNFWKTNAKSPFQLRAKSKSDKDFFKWEQIQASMVRTGNWRQPKEEPKQATPKTTPQGNFRDVLGNDL